MNKGRKQMKILKRITVGMLLLCYLAATIVQSNFWGNILSPIIIFIAFLVTYKAFVHRKSMVNNPVPGLFLSMGMLVWSMTDVLWAIYDMILYIDPEEINLITYGYLMTNIFLVIAVAIYTYHIFRKWNTVQVILDAVVMSLFIIELVWIAFLNEDVKNIMMIRSDWVSTVAIVTDIIMVIAITIWFVSIRYGKMPLYLWLISVGVLFYSITDLVYYWQYFFSIYEPNTIMDFIYVADFYLIALAAVIYLDRKDTPSEIKIYNIGRKGKGYGLFLAPVLFIILKGFDVIYVLHFVMVILLYIMLSSYIKRNLYKESLLRKEKELNNDLEQKVKVRTEELEEKNKVLQELIDQDLITGLYNRRYCLAYLEEAIYRLREEEAIILLYIDINRFKMITTMFGNFIGETVLFEFAQRLKPIQERIEKSILASYGDDSYIFAAIGKQVDKQGLELASEIIRLCSDIYYIEEYQIRVTVNIGISTFPYNSSSKEELIRHADIAMTQARMQGFNVVHQFDLKLSEAFFRKNSIEIMLKKNNIMQEFLVYYQPQLYTNSKKIFGFEALLRWKTATGEFIAPNEFIPVAEETGYIIPIGDWVMKMVMKQLVNWNSRFEEKIMISINVSLKQLNSRQFLEKIQEEMNSLSIKPEWIDLEITESLQLQENPDVMKMLTDIRELGISISIDDFGTGYSSLSYFKSLPADRIKLAKELIDYIHVDEFDYQLVKSIILLSRAKGIRVIAEGVETKEQWEALKELQCDEVQGFLFGRPLPPEEIEKVFGGDLIR
jgi:diguanylate cyclase (GGDEF)-like protein